MIFLDRINPDDSGRCRAQRDLQEKRIVHRFHRLTQRKKSFTMKSLKDIKF